jgi:hypothetical protein
MKGTRYISLVGITSMAFLFSCEKEGPFEVNK